jgi:hypothetical protein
MQGGTLSFYISAPGGAVEGSLGQSEGRGSLATPQVSVPTQNVPIAPAGAQDPTTGNVHHTQCRSC